MLFKIIGGLIILGASILLGNILANDCSRRPRNLRELQAMLQMLENEITYMSSLLSDAFAKIHETGHDDVKRIFGRAAHILKNDEGIHAAAAWEKAVREEACYTGLTREDIEILISFGSMLGNSDTEGQVNNIRLVLTQLRIQEQKAEELRKKNEAMFRKLGILGGLALIIILL